MHHGNECEEEGADSQCTAERNGAGFGVEGMHSREGEDRGDDSIELKKVR